MNCYIKKSSAKTRWPLTYDQVYKTRNLFNFNKIPFLPLSQNIEAGSPKINIMFQKSNEMINWKKSNCAVPCNNLQMPTQMTISFHCKTTVFCSHINGRNLQSTRIKLMHIQRIERTIFTIYMSARLGRWPKHFPTENIVV